MQYKLTLHTISTNFCTTWAITLIKDKSMLPSNSSRYDRFEFSNKQSCSTCGVTFYCNRYFDVPKYCSQTCHWYKDDIKKEKQS